LYKLHQNVWQRVSTERALPRALGSPREGRKKGGLTIDGGREVASGLDPQDL